jgi:hypothetical protein
LTTQDSVKKIGIWVLVIACGLYVALNLAVNTSASPRYDSATGRIFATHAGKGFGQLVFVQPWLGELRYWDGIFAIVSILVTIWAFKRPEKAGAVRDLPPDL